MKRRARRGRITGWLAIGCLVLAAAGCARPDWIEQTLVTVDVTGVWRGTYLRVGGSGNLELTLQQSGPKVTGRATSAGHSSGRSMVPSKGPSVVTRFAFAPREGGAVNYT